MTSVQPVLPAWSTRSAAPPPGAGWRRRPPQVVQVQAAEHAVPVGVVALGAVEKFAPPCRRSCGRPLPPGRSPSTPACGLVRLLVFPQEFRKWPPWTKGFISGILPPGNRGEVPEPLRPREGPHFDIGAGGKVDPPRAARGRVLPSVIVASRPAAPRSLRRIAAATLPRRRFIRPARFELLSVVREDRRGYGVPRRHPVDGGKRLLHAAEGGIGGARPGKTPHRAAARLR